MLHYLIYRRILFELFNSRLEYRIEDLEQYQEASLLIFIHLLLVFFDLLKELFCEKTDIFID